MGIRKLMCSAVILMTGDNTDTIYGGLPVYSKETFCSRANNFCLLSSGRLQVGIRQNKKKTLKT